jgi:hypothetical protein
MPKVVTITDITGTTPYDIYLCDNPVTICVYVDTITTLPYSFTMPSVLENQDDYTLKVEDDNGCINYTILTL